MITQEQIDNLRVGEKLIFFRDGGVISAKKGAVFTFSNWYEKYGNEKHIWQCKELLDLGNNVHNFSIYDTEIFNETIHKDFILMNEYKLSEQKKDFIKKYG